MLRDLYYRVVKANISFVCFCLFFFTVVGDVHSSRNMDAIEFPFVVGRVELLIPCCDNTQ